MNKLAKIRFHLQKIRANASSFIQCEANNSFYIVDNGTSEIHSECEDENKCFAIKNQNNKEICFIPIDGNNGLLNHRGTSCCDAVVFNEQYFCFLEFKFNATSVEIRAIRKNRKKAIEQLSKTIDFFDDQLDKDYLDLKLEAFISTPKTYPRQDTAWVNIEVEFLEEYGIPLFETNEKEFIEDSDD